MSALAPRILLIMFAIVGCAWVARAEAKPKKAAELNWARSVALDFMEAAVHGDIDQAESLIASPLKAVYAAQGEAELRDWLNNQIAIRGFRKPAIAEGEISPDRDEAFFRGTLEHGEDSFRFTLRVLKDEPDGKWRVSFVRIRAASD